MKYKILIKHLITVIDAHIVFIKVDYEFKNKDWQKRIFRALELIEEAANDIEEYSDDNI